MGILHAWLCEPAVCACVCLPIPFSSSPHDRVQPLRLAAGQRACSPAQQPAKASNSNCGWLVAHNPKIRHSQVPQCTHVCSTQCTGPPRATFAPIWGPILPKLKISLTEAFRSDSLSFRLYQFNLTQRFISSSLYLSRQCTFPLQLDWYRLKDVELFFGRKRSARLQGWGTVVSRTVSNVLVISFFLIAPIVWITCLNSSPKSYLVVD